MQRNGSRVASLIVAVMFWALLNTTLWAQTNTGTISGTVKDSSGAMVPNAQVTITNTSQQTSERLQTNNVGAYVAPSLGWSTNAVIVPFASTVTWMSSMTMRSGAGPCEIRRKLFTAVNATPALKVATVVVAPVP